MRLDLWILILAVSVLSLPITITKIHTNVQLVRAAPTGVTAAPELDVRDDNKAAASTDDNDNNKSSKDDKDSNQKSTDDSNSRATSSKNNKSKAKASDTGAESSSGLLVVSQVNTSKDKNDKNSASGTGTDSGTNTGTDTATGKKTKGKTSKGKGSKTTKKHKPSSTSEEEINTSTISINPVDAPGGIELEQPATTISTTYIKAGNAATFQWKYTSLSITPKSLNVLAVCTMNAMTYTLTKNMPAKKTQFIWDTGAWQEKNSIKLLTSMYSLKIFDSHSNMSAVPRAGFLEPFSYTFGVYQRQEYVPWAGDSTYVNMAYHQQDKSRIWAFLVSFAVVSVFSAVQLIS